MKKNLWILSCAFILFFVPVFGEDSGKNSTPASAQKSVTVFMVGDSTMSEFSDNYYYPRYGYGTQLQNFLSGDVTVSNLALSGRSSKSFVSEKNYSVLKGNIKKGDYLIIGFGHNDEKTDPGLYTDPTKPASDAVSFKYHLYTYYIKTALDAGATPILCTPIVRRSPSGTYTGSYIHSTNTETTGGVTYNGGDYAKCIRDLGKEKGITVIDATALTKSLYESLGASGTLSLHAWLNTKESSVDNTHLNIFGAKYVSYLVAKALNSSDSSLKQFVRADIAAPVKTADLAPNKKFVQPAYNAPSVKSSLWKTQEADWWGTVFGDCGGAEKISDGVTFDILSPAVSSVKINAGTKEAGVGKIAANTDGVAMYFRKIPVSADFTLTATATVGAYLNNADNQVSFGLMVRDAVLIDTFDNSFLANYVVCGPLFMKRGAGAWWSSYCRDTVQPSGSQLAGTTTGAGVPVPASGNVIKLSVSKKGNVYTVKYGNEAAAVYTLDLNLVDSDYIYAGPFAARKAEVTFTDIRLTIDPAKK